VVNPVLVEVERSGFVESRHRGTALGVNADGSSLLELGAVDEPMFPRSANKPLQAVAMLRAGLPVAGELLALAAASHSGEDFHAEGVEKILAGAGLAAQALQCPAAWPMELPVALGVARSGGAQSEPRMNCSGKHAAMLATCAVNGWPTASYLSADHPLQRKIRDTVADLTGQVPAVAGVDGCGAPLFSTSVRGIARAFRTLVLAPAGSPERAVADAMRAHPQWTSGTRREERLLMDAVPGLLIKCGAEGVDTFALADGRAGAVKIDDGAMRARTPVTVALLAALGVMPDETLAALATPPVYGGGQIVGTIRPTAVFGV
jgi:L-asparaginase II